MTPYYYNSEVTAYHHNREVTANYDIRKVVAYFYIREVTRYYYNKDDRLLLLQRWPKRGKDSICTERVSKHGIFKMYAENIMMDNNLDVPLLYKIISR